MVYIQDITFEFPDGRKEVFKSVKERKIAVTDGIAAFNLFSALDTPMGFVVCGPGTVIKYSNDALTTSQIDENGHINMKTEVDSD